MAEFSENRHISNLINMSCKVVISFEGFKIPAINLYQLFSYFFLG